MRSEVGALVAPDGAHVVRIDAVEPAARVAIVASRYHAGIVQRLVDGAFGELAGHGIPTGSVSFAAVPGAFELALAAKRFALQHRYVAVIVLGCVIRGDTPHFEFVCAEAARGVTLASLETGVPIAFGVITADTMEQAQARAGGEVGNVGADAARAALELAGMLRGISTR